ncbi:MAG: hypothetical protein EOP88_21130 [Verrucomicrobiaceae bacterium]|nr:MAG: hypothetical protein EOP88_21130 [Verrucomicrobiaceae bacterium]
MSAKQSPKSTSPQPRRRHPAKSLRKGGSPGDQGNLTGPEKAKLAIQANEAFAHQLQLGRIEPGQKVDDWRREMVQDLTGKAGISKIHRMDWKPVMAMFLTLAGKDDEAFTLLNKTGKKSYRPKGEKDTWETCETYVALIREALEDHASVPAASLHDERGHIRLGWLLQAARQRTNKPTLIMDTLAERLDPETLHGLLSHLRNHIAKREGRDQPDRRQPRAYPKPADPGEMDETV